MIKSIIIILIINIYLKDVSLEQLRGETLQNESNYTIIRNQYFGYQILIDNKVKHDHCVEVKEDYKGRPICIKGTEIYILGNNIINEINYDEYGNRISYISLKLEYEGIKMCGIKYNIKNGTINNIQISEDNIYLIECKNGKLEKSIETSNEWMIDQNIMNQIFEGSKYTCKNNNELTIINNKSDKGTKVLPCKDGCENLKIKLVGREFKYIINDCDDCIATKENCMTIFGVERCNNDNYIYTNGKTCAYN